MIERLVLLCDEVVRRHVLVHVGVGITFLTLSRSAKAAKEEREVEDGLLESDVRVDKEDVSLLQNFDEACMGGGISLKF